MPKSGLMMPTAKGGKAARAQAQRMVAREGKTLAVAARNDERPDAQSRAVSGAR